MKLSPSIMYQPNVAVWNHVYLKKSRWLKRSVALTNLLVLFCAGGATAGPQDNLVGQNAPLFTVLDMNGKPRSIKELYGKKNLLLTFFPKCFTFNCTNQVTSLRGSYPTLHDHDIEIWAVSTDEAGGARGQQAYARHLKLPFPLLPDPNRKLCLLYGAVNSPNQMAARMTVFIDKKGTIRWIDKQIYPPTHGADVVNRLKAERYFG